MFAFITRPKYHSQELLIEFDSYSNEKMQLLINEINTTLLSSGITCTNIQNLWMNDETVYTMEGEFGTISLSIDIWDLAFITAANNQAIKNIETILLESGKFIKKETDYEKYI